MRRTIRTIFVALPAALLLLGGCGRQAPETSFTDAVDSFAREIWTRTEEATAACMESLGFDYAARVFDAEGGRALASLSPYVLDIDEARSRGFGIVDAQIASVAEPEAATGAQSSSASYDDALYGTGLDGSGCREQATAQAYKEVDPAKYPAVQEREQAVERILADPRTGAFWAAWSQCMGEAGLAAADIDDLLTSLHDQAARIVTIQDPTIDATSGEVVAPANQVIDHAVADRLRSAEITAAVASVQCLEPLRGQWDEISDVQP